MRLTQLAVEIYGSLSHVVKWIPEKKIGGDANGDHFIATHRFQPGPPFAARVVPAPVVTDKWTARSGGR